MILYIMAQCAYTIWRESTTEDSHVNVLEMKTKAYGVVLGGWGGAKACHATPDPSCRKVGS